MNITLDFQLLADYWWIFAGIGYFILHIMLSRYYYPAWDKDDRTNKTLPPPIIVIIFTTMFSPLFILFAALHFLITFKNKS